jgi:hypothetical protein
VAICDDYADEIYVGETWTATVNSLSTPSAGLKWGTQANYATEYEEAAWLGNQLLNSTPTCPNAGNCDVAISYAIWGVFYPAALSGLDPNDLANANAMTTDAATAIGLLPAGDLSGFEILTPVSGSYPSGDGLPQEFLYFNPDPNPNVGRRVPEAPTAVLLGGGVLGLLALFVAFRRGKVRTA